MLIRLFLLWIFLLTCVWLMAEPFPKDSLLQIIKNEKLSEKERMPALFLLIEAHYLGENADSSQFYGQQLHDMAEKSKDGKMLGWALSILGNTAILNGKYNEADSLYTRALAEFEILNDPIGLASANNGLGQVYENAGQFEKALNQYLAAIDLWNQIGKTDKIVMTLINIAACYEGLGDIRTSMKYNLQAVEKAQQYKEKRQQGVARNNLANNYKFLGDIPNSSEQYRNALAIYEELEATWLIIGTLNNLGLLYMNDGDYANAKNYLEQAYQLAEETKNLAGKAQSLSNLGAVKSNQGNFSEALQYLKKALGIIEEIQLFFIVPYHKMEIGNMYLQMGQLDSAEVYLKDGMANCQQFGPSDDLISGSLHLSKLYVQKGNWTSALHYAQDGLRRAQESERINLAADLADQLVDVYKHFGRNKEALEMIELQVAIKDSLYNEENTRTLIRQELQYDYDKKALRDSLANANILAAQKADIQRRKLMTNFLVGFLLLTLLFGGFLYTRYRLIQKQKRIIQEEKIKSEAANAKLLEIDQSKSRFFTNISHEFRTPLTVISGMSEQIRQPERAKDLIKRNTNHLLQLINQILDLRKLESGSLKTKYIQADVVRYLRYITESFQSLAIRKEIEMSFSSSAVDLVLDYDPEKLLRIISNLLANAVKFTPNQGKIEFAIRRDEESYQFSVSDNGAGIPEEKIPYLFDRFYQVDGSSTRMGEGTGIGLTLVNELVQLMGGEIEVQSEEGRGSKFAVRLPISNKAPIEMEDAFLDVLNQPEDSTLSEPFIPTTVSGSEELPSLLIVEDNPDIMEYLITCLEGDYRLSFAVDGQEGIEKALDQVPDIIISDVMMPRKDGFTLCQELKTDERTSHIPIVMLTARADVESRITGLQRGADAYLAKPFNKRELDVQLKNLLAQRQRLQQRYANVEMLEPTKDRALQQEDAFILKLKEIFEEKMDDPAFDLNALSKALLLSRSQLGRKVKALTGLSPAIFLRTLRLQKGKQLLLSTNLSIKEIAFEIGFSNPNYFTNTYTDYFGENPTKTRNLG